MTTLWLKELEHCVELNALVHWKAIGSIKSRRIVLRDDHALATGARTLCGTECTCPMETNWISKISSYSVER